PAERQPRTSSQRKTRLGSCRATGVLLTPTRFPWARVSSKGDGGTPIMTDRRWFHSRSALPMDWALNLAIRSSSMCSAETLPRRLQTCALSTGKVWALISSWCFRRIPFAAHLTHILQLSHILVAARRRRNRLLSQPWRRRSLWLRRYG